LTFEQSYQPRCDLCGDCQNHHDPVATAAARWITG
jgi:hypothetical protein